MDVVFGIAGVFTKRSTKEICTSYLITLLINTPKDISSTKPRYEKQFSDVIRTVLRKYESWTPPKHTQTHTHTHTHTHTRTAFYDSVPSARVKRVIQRHNIIAEAPRDSILDFLNIL